MSITIVSLLLVLQKVYSLNVNNITDHCVSEYASFYRLLSYLKRKAKNTIGCINILMFKLRVKPSCARGHFINRIWYIFFLS